MKWPLIPVAVAATSVNSTMTRRVASVASLCMVDVRATTTGSTPSRNAKPGAKTTNGGLITGKH